MRKITYICDNCEIEVEKFDKHFGAIEPKYLFLVDNQEWCEDCFREMLKTFKEKNEDNLS